MLNKIFSSPKNSLLLFALLSALALATAFISQYGFGLAPCELCIFQRWPYGVVIALGIIGFFTAGKSRAAGIVLLVLTALTFFANAGIAFYHTGVERKWWPSFLEGCSTPSLEGNIADVLARIEAAPLVRCDEIPWTDPILGWSMANYNVIACFGLGILAIYALLKSCRTKI